MWIVNRGTGSLGSHAVYELVGEDILEEIEEIHEGRMQHIRFGWKFRAKQPGDCMIIVQEIDGGDVAYIDEYNICVDEELNITYEKERIYIEE